MMMRSVFALLAVLWVSFGVSEVSAAAGLKKITLVPSTVSPKCRKGKAKLYDACSDQLVLLNRAMRKAKAEKKILLVSFGADWCIWCHVFAHHVYGKTKRFTYTYGAPNAPDDTETSTLYERSKLNVRADAIALNNFVADHFVLFHVDAQFAPNGAQVVRNLGAGPYYGKWIPYIFTVGRKGKYAGHFEHKVVEKRRDGATDWYRGYDRKKLLGELKRMYQAAREQ